MGLIKRADIEDYTRDACVMDLTDLEKRGRVIVDAANAEAQSILSLANAKRKQLIASAEKAGYDKGHRDGYEQGYIDGVVNGVEDAKKDRAQVLDQLMEIWTSQLDAFENQRDEMLEQARTQVVELGALIAQRVTKRIIELDPTVVRKQMESVLSNITESTRLVIAVHPDDIGMAQEALPKLIERFATCEHAQVVTDATIEQGSCVTRTATGGVIDASISTQLDRILDALLPHSANGAGLEIADAPVEEGTGSQGNDAINDAKEDAA